MQNGSLQKQNTLVRTDDSLSERQPTAEPMERKVTARPARGIGRQWSQCSLCSIDSLDIDDVLPIPGRESHTSDMRAFSFHLLRLRSIQRFEGDPPFNVVFWTFIIGVLETAKEVGYSGSLDPDDVSPKGPQDNDAFANKIKSTSVINPIHPEEIARQSGVPLDGVLTELLYATLSGMLSMRWGPSCENCGGIVCGTKKKSRQKKVGDYCQGCRYTNAIDCLKKIKVAFVFNLDIFYGLAESFDCKSMKKAMDEDEMFAIVPATFTGSGFRYSLGCGGGLMLRPALEAGEYRMHCPVAMTDNILVVQRDATEDDEPYVLPVHVSDIVYRGEVRKTLTVPHGKIHMDIYTDTQSFFICWIQKHTGEQQQQQHTETANDKPTLTTAQEVMDHPTYQCLFENTELEADYFSNAVKKMFLEPENDKALKPIS